MSAEQTSGTPLAAGVSADQTPGTPLAAGVSAEQTSGTPPAAGASGNERVRLFVAVELPQVMRDTLARWAAGAVAGAPAWRPVRTESLHLTLCFLGERPAAALGAIESACHVAAGAPAPGLALAEPLWLPRSRPRVLAVALSEPGPDSRLEPLQAALAAALSAGGFYEPETRPYLAHVTVARAGRGAAHGPLPRLAGIAAPEALAFVPEWVTLYRSRLGGGPARYEPLARVALGSDPATGR